MHLFDSIVTESCRIGSFGNRFIDEKSRADCDGEEEEEDRSDLEEAG